MGAALDAPDGTRLMTCRRAAVVLALILVVALPIGMAAQARRSAPARRPPPKGAPAATVKAPADVKCPSVLGIGVATRLVFCDVMTATDAAAGIVIAVPPHRGPATLTFNLHNRHTYSEEAVRARKAFARYTATVAVTTEDGTVIDRGVVQNEFRTPADMYDRIAGGAGPSGIKAIAPTGVQSISVQLPENADSVSVVGEKVTVDRVDGTASYTAPGTPIAIVSNIALEYRPAPPRRKRP
jgi:hypothetical protein